MSVSVPYSILSEKLRHSTDKQSFYDIVKLEFMLTDDAFLLFELKRPDKTTAKKKLKVPTYMPGKT